MPTAEEIAYQLGVPGRTLRAWLRPRYPNHIHGDPWIFTDSEADRVRRDYRARTAPRRTGTGLGFETAEPPVARDTDETYVIDLCDQVIGAAALRQHRFDWLRGDPNASGNRRMLPVDAYYPGKRLVVEYMERQHSEPVAHFDKPDRMTVSGVHRGDQRRLYDERRREEIPAHGISLVTIRFDDLRVDKSGRLLRDPTNDVAVLRARLDGLV